MTTLILSKLPSRKSIWSESQNERDKPKTMVAINLAQTEVVQIACTTSVYKPTAYKSTLKHSWLRGDLNQERANLLLRPTQMWEHPSL